VHDVKARLMARAARLDSLHHRYKLESDGVPLDLKNAPVSSRSRWERASRATSDAAADCGTYQALTERHRFTLSHALSRGIHSLAATCRPTPLRRHRRRRRVPAEALLPPLDHFRQLKPISIRCRSCSARLVIEVSRDCFARGPFSES